MRSLFVNHLEGLCKIASDFDLILFDKDGTLIDIHHYWASMIRLRSQRITELLLSQNSAQHAIVNRLADTMGIDLSSGRMKPEGPVGVKPRSFIVETVAKTVCGLGIDQTAEQIENIFKKVDEETSQNLLPYLKLLPGVKSFLSQARDRGITLAIVTTDITSRAEKAVEALQIGSFFDQVIGADQVEHSKPAPDIATLAMRRCGVIPEKSVMIGDHPVDIKMGIQSGIRFNIGVLTGLSDEAAFQNLNCKIVNSLEDLKIL